MGGVRGGDRVGKTGPISAKDGSYRTKLFLDFHSWFQKALKVPGGSRIPYGSFWSQQGPD